MKQLNITFLLGVLMSMLCMEMFAHDIEIANEDGQTIYYVWTNNNTELAVSYKGYSYTMYGNEYSGSIVIPHSVTYSGINYPVTSIGNSAFSGCSGLTSVTIPSSVTSIGSSVFTSTAWYNNQPDGLVYAGKVAYKYKGTMPQNTAITIKEGTVGIAGAAFSYCYNLTSVTIPSSVTTIGSSAFQGCSKLNSVTIPSNVTSIGSSAFCDCSELNYVYSEIESPFTFGASAFYGISPVCVLTIPANTKDQYLNAGWTIDVFKGGVIDPALPEVVSIEKGNWFTAKTIEGVDMRFMITDVSQYTVQVGLSSSNEYWKSTKVAVNKTISGTVTIPDKVVYGGIEFSVTYIANAAFRECSKITSINIPESVTHIGHGAFEFCSGLTSIYIPNSVTSIDDGYAFVDCANLQSIHLSKNLKVIPNDTFTRCYSLTSVTIPEGVTNIGNNIGDAFYNCTGLTTIIIPSSVTYYVGNSFSFNNTSNLANVIVHRAEPVNISSNCFKNRRNATLYVPVGSKVAYEEAAVWKEFKKIIEINEPIEQTVALIALPEMTYGDAPFTLPKNTNEELPLTWASSNSTVAAINGNQLTINRSGTATITATQTGNDDYQPLNLEFTLTIAKAPLIIKADDQMKMEEQDNPTLTATYEGFKYSDNALSLNMQPIITTSATAESPAGSYPINVLGAQSDNYEISYVSGTMIVTENPYKVTDISKFTNAVYLEPFKARIGGDIEVAICLKNAQEASAYNFDLVLPEGVTIAKDSNGRYIDALSDRHDDHTRTFNYKGDNIYSFATLSGNSEALTGNDGAIRLITLHVADDVAEGTYAIEIKNASYSQPNGTEILLPNIITSITAESYVLGDVNGNGHVDIGDAVSVVNYLVGKPSTSFVEKAADTNKNGHVDIGDAVTIVNFLVGKTASLSRSNVMEIEPQ